MIARLQLAALCLGIAAVAWLGHSRADLKADNEALSEQLAIARANEERAAAAAAVHRAHLARAADQRRAAQAIINELQSMEGRDAPLSPVLSATVERLYGTR